MLSTRKICVITGTRAEYGLLYWLMKDIRKNPNLELQIIATGMHMSPEFGLTYKEIEKDGFKINKKIEMLISADTPTAIGKSTGMGIIGFSDTFDDLNPDIIIITGDRYEAFSASVSALFANKPVLHIHGGEITSGAYDDAMRHSISKMSYWHFVANDVYKNRVIQLGEEPSRVLTVGGLGVDSIKKSRLLDKKILEEKIGFKFGKKNLLVTYHPTTLDHNSSKKDFHQLLLALSNQKDTKIIFTYSNSDTDGRIINQMIDNYVSENGVTSVAFKSMGSLNFLSAMQFIDGLIGNSSSGLLEAPTFKIGTINIGNRQKGRLKASSIIDCLPEKQSISKAIKKMYSKSFYKILQKTKNPYGDGGASKKIVEFLAKIELPTSLEKFFFDIDYNYEK